MLDCKRKRAVTTGQAWDLQIVYYFGSGLDVALLVFDFPNVLFMVCCVTGYDQTKGGATSSGERGVSEREGEEEEEQVHLCDVKIEYFSLLMCQ